MMKLATKLACATVCVLLFCTAGQSQTLSDQQIAKVREIIHDAVQPSIDAINQKIDTLVGVIRTNHLNSRRGAQVERVADYKTENNDLNNKDDEHEHKYVKKIIYNIYCCRSHWYHCCRPHYCRPRCDGCYKPHYNHCYRPHHYCRHGDDP
jgi:hypothetical protein